MQKTLLNPEGNGFALLQLLSVEKERNDHNDRRNTPTHK